MTKRTALFSFFLPLLLFSPPTFAKDTSWQTPYAAAKKALRQHRPAEAEKFFKDAVRKAEASNQDQSRRDNLVVSILYELAGLYEGHSRYDEAVDVYERCLSILRKSLGPADRRVCWAASKYAEALGQAGRPSEAGRVPTCYKMQTRP